MAMTYSVEQVRQRYGVSQGTVLSWIRDGALRAINVGVSRSKLKPRWRVTEEACREFEEARQAVPAQPRPARRRRKRETVEAGVKFYE